MAISTGAAAAPRRDTLEQYLPLVRGVARRYARSGVELDDLVQAGAVGLVHAVDRYRPERGDFLPFALATVSGEIRRHLRDRVPAVRLPRGLLELLDRLRRLEAELTASLGRAPTVAELAEAAGSDAAAVAEARLGAAPPAPLTELTPAAADDPFARAEDRLLVRESLRALDERSRRIVQLHYGHGLSQAEVARAVGLSPAHVSRLLRRALATMRAQAGVPDAA